MRVLHTYVFLFLSSMLERVASAKKKESGATAKFKTKIVSNDFCESSLLAEDKKGKHSLEDVHSYAELKHDPRSALPNSFTICSEIMTTNCRFDWWPLFFTILNDNGTIFLAPGRSHGSLENIFIVYSAHGSSGSLYRGGGADGDSPPFSTINGREAVWG